MPATTTRYAGSSNGATNLPILAATTVAPSAGEVYPSARAINRISSTGTVARTWIAQDTTLGWYQAITRIGTNGLAAANTSQYMVCDPASVSWGSITMTGPRPQNPQGGIARYNTTIATATLKNGGVTLQTSALTEENEPILTGNTLTVASKLPPICQQNDVGVNAFSSTMYYDSTAIPWLVVRYGAFRWLGGSISVVCLAGIGVWSIYVVPINTGTYTDDISTAVLLGTCPNNAGATFSAASVAAAGVVRWNQFWIYATPSSPLGTFRLFLNSPFDLPPPYDCPGYDVPLLKGGYLV